MPVAAAVVGSAVVGGVMSSRAQKKAANSAANAQIQSSEMGVEEQRRQFDAVQKPVSYTHLTLPTKRIV